MLLLSWNFFEWPELSLPTVLLLDCNDYVINVADYGVEGAFVRRE